MKEGSSGRRRRPPGTRRREEGGVGHSIVRSRCRRVVRSSSAGGLSSEGEEEKKKRRSWPKQRSNAHVKPRSHDDSRLSLSNILDVTLVRWLSRRDPRIARRSSFSAAAAAAARSLARARALLATGGPRRRTAAHTRAYVSRGAPPAVADGGGEGEARGEAFARHRDAQAGAARQDRGQGSSAMTEGDFSMA